MDIGQQEINGGNYQGTANLHYGQTDVHQVRSGQTGKKINPLIVKLIVRSAYALLIIAVLTLGVGIGHNVGMRASEPSEDFYKDRMPKKAYIHGQRWYIDKGDKDQELDLIEAYGVTDCKNHIVIIHSGMTLAGERDTLLHELMHANVCISDAPNNGYYLSVDGHQTIAKTSQFIAELFITNKELARYMFELN